MRKLKKYVPTRFMAEDSHYDKAEADFAVNFIENLCHTKGTWARKKFELMDWQEQIIRDVFGTIKPNGYRQFNMAYVEIPKKNGKSELAAAVALLLLCEGEQRGEIYSCAADKNQAKIVFDVAADMVRFSKSLSKRIKIYESQKKLEYLPTKSTYQVLSADVSNKHGFNTHGVIFDELHTQPNRKLYDVMVQGSGDARMQPLYFLITTAGNNTESICYEVHQKALDIMELTNSIERQQRAERREQELSKPVNSPITGKPYKDEPQGEVKTGRASDEYKKAMLTALRSNFRQVSNVLQEGVDADGGYLVPEEYDHRLIDVLTEENIMRGIATKITTSGEHKINIAATKPAAAWIEEGEALSFGDATFEQKILDAHKLHVAIKITEELLYDNAFGLENYIITEFGKALANAEEDAFLNGDGVGKPTGIFDKTKGGESIGTLTAALKSDDILDLIYKLKRPYRKNASFIMNDATLAQIRKLKDNNGQYLWQPSYQANEPDKILGYNIRTSAFAPTDAIAFGDYKYYNIGDRGSRSFKQLNELFAGNGMIGYVAKERVDGLLILPEAVKILGLKSETTTTATK